MNASFDKQDALSAVSSLPKVAILMATYNGGRFLAAQLDSILAQQYPHWVLYVSDDGSSDDTVAILAQFKPRFGDRLVCLRGPGAGLVANFHQLLANQAIQADFYAYADQDDLWYPDKIWRAVSWLGRQPASQPALYCSRARLINESGEVLGYSPYYRRKPGFANALVQNLAGGNSMVFNAEARSLVAHHVCEVTVVVHDWWMYIMVTGCGGKVGYDTEPTLDERQHTQNQIGAKAGLRGLASRLDALRAGRVRRWNATHLRALAVVAPLLTVSARQRLVAFRNVHYGRFWFVRLPAMAQAGLYHQRCLGQLGLWLGALFRLL